MPVHLNRKIKFWSLLLFMLTSVVVTFSFMPQASAETKIITLTPSSGYVGTTIQLVANITTANGTYVIQFDAENVTSGTAVGNNVSTSFVVPHAPAGSHNVTIIDDASGEKDTTTFTVLTFYSFQPLLPDSPAQLQQEANLTISINMTGGNSNYTYPKLTVQTPGNIKYEAQKNITTDIVGDFYGDLTYPDDFANANTNFTGKYSIIFNGTTVSEFFIGLTNSSEYHRGDVVNIKAVDYYPPNENVTITIKFGDTIVDAPINWTAIDGAIDVNWVVPPNLTIGNYNLSITPVPKSKENASDTQIFAVPGFKTEIFTRNLGDKTVPNVFVKSYDVSANVYSNVTSDVNGSAVLMLERGNYSWEAFFKEVKVGERNFTVTQEEEVNFTCRLVTMNISVVDAENHSLPQVSISLNYNYTTDLDPKNKTGADSGETDVNGMLQLPYLLPNVTYAINASRYGEVFNQGNDTVTDLPPMAYVDVLILCPTRTLQLKVVDAYNKSIANVDVRAQELMGGLFYSNSTDINGECTFECTLGKYTIKVYADEIQLNESAIDLFQNQNVTVVCELYGLNVSIKVIDYFGQPIPNANVTLQREHLAMRSQRTGSDGVATFSNIIGGDLQIAVYLPSQTQSCIATSFSVDKSTTISLTIGKYVALLGFLIETSQLTTIIIILVSVILVLLVEVYRRRLKPRKTEN